MNDLEKHLEASLKDSEFKEEWEAQKSERMLMHKIVEARIAEGLSQQELAKRCNMKPSNLSRLENGNANPSLATLEKVAQGLGRKLEINFV